jgi:uncharacterized protein (TIGR03067 family)
MSPSLLTALALAAGAPAPKDPPKPAPSVVGEWVAERRTFSGNERAIAGGPLRYVFTADGRWEVYHDRKKVPGDQRYKADPAKDPAEIDLDTATTEPDHRRVTPGIYKVEGDTLTLCYSPASRGAQRPKAFTSTADTPNVLYVFKRVKTD